MPKKKKYQTGGQIKEVKKFYNDYLNSPNHKKRLTLQGYADPEQTISDRLSRINLTTTSFVPGAGTSYSTSKGNINFDKEEAKKYGYLPTTTAAHEYSHTAGALGFTDMSLKGNEYLNPKEIQLLDRGNKSTDPHDRMAGESKADIDAFRYLLYKDKIYNTGTQQFNNDYLNKGKEKYRNDPTIKRLFNKYSDADLIYLMNNIAQNTPQQTDTPMAKSGISIKKKKYKGQAGITLDNTQMLPLDMQSTNPYNWMQTTNDGIPPIPTKKNTPNFDLSGALATGLAAIDAIIPTKKRNSTVIRPALSYNEHPYGTGSQAIAEQGITVSKTGYKANSKDRNKKHLRIPSSNITMKNVPHPVVGTDNLGNTQVMVPGNEYQFPGDYVDETPLIAQSGTKPIYTSNPNDPRIRAYRDSMNVYNADQKYQKAADKWEVEAYNLWNQTHQNYNGRTDDYSQDRGPWKDLREARDKEVFPLDSLTNVAREKSFVPNEPNEDIPAKVFRTLFNQRKKGFDTFIDGYRTGYKRPVQPVIYRKPEDPIKNLGPAHQFQPSQLPDVGEWNPSVSPNLPTFEQKKTNYSFTFPMEGYNQQKTVYFPDKENWKKFMEKRKYSSQEGSDYGTSTGYLENGGSITVPANYKPIKAQAGTNVPRLTPEQIGQFNGFNKYVKDKGFTQSEKLNNQQFSKGLYDEYRKTNPGVQLSYEEMIPRAQQEQYLLKDFSSGIAKRRGAENADSVMDKITKFDGLYGPKTSYYDLPQMSVVDKQNGQVVNQQNLGIITGTGQPTGIGGSGKAMGQKTLPPGAKLEPLYDSSGNKTGMGYTDPSTGDTVHMKAGGWISGAVNPAHKGYCTPMTKSTCTPRRKAFAMTMKKHHGFHKAEDGLTILDENTVKFNGPSHAEGGIPISYAGKNVEVEGDETGYISPEDGSLSIMGNMTNPLTGRKFKSDSKLLSKKKEKATDLTAYASKLLEESNPTDKWQNLTFNSAKVMLNGGFQKAKEIEQSQEHLKTIQEAMLEHSNEMGYDPQEFSKGKAKMGKLMTIFPTVLENGGTIKYQDGGRIKYNQTRTQGLDNKIKEFASLLEKKGFSGTSGPESGQSKRNTLSGRKSRHASGQALDLVLNNPEAYQAVLKDPDLSKFLIDNGLTVLNEYDPTIQKKTGATTGHLHVGYDQGTPISDQFRTDAANIYKSANPTWKWGNKRPVNSAPLKGVPSGDQQYFPYEIPPVDYTPIPTAPNQSTPQTKLPNYIPGSDFQNTTNPALPSDAQPLELGQILPEIYTAATNRQEPVFAQQYNPELYQPYQVSFQDRLNENQGTFNSLEKAAAYNPSALATLASQQYSADSGVLADEFRTNQGIYNDVTNKNIALLNDAQGKNLQIADNQYVRQSQAKSNTKAINHDVLNSISNKLLQREADNKALQVYENLYDYRYNEKKNMNLEYLGAPGAEYVDWQGDPVQSQNTNQSSRTTYSPSGSVKSTSVSNPSPLSTQLKQERLSTLKQDNILKLLNSTKKNGKYSYLPPELWMNK